MFVDSNGELISYFGDYGIGVTFTIDNLELGDTIIVTFSDYILEKTFQVDSENFEFNLSLSEEDVDHIPSHGYSFYVLCYVKQYRDGVFLDTIYEGKLHFKRHMQLNRYGEITLKSPIREVSISNIKGTPGKDGKDYILTDADKEEIISDMLSRLSLTSEVLYGD